MLRAPGVRSSVYIPVPWKHRVEGSGIFGLNVQGYLGFRVIYIYISWGYMGRMEKKMETTLIF